MAAGTGKWQWSNINDKMSLFFYTFSLAAYQHQSAMAVSHEWYRTYKVFLLLFSYI